MSTPARVLLHAFSTFNLGGPQARFVQLANAFGPAYFHIVAAMDNCFVAGERLENNVRWEPLRLDIRKDGALANRGNFREILKTQRPDLLLSYNWGAIEWAAANTPTLVPHVHVEDGFGPEEAGGQLPRRVWMRRALLSARGVPTFVASRNLERIATGTWWMRKSRVKFIANGVSVPCERPVAQQALGDTDRVLTIGTVAGLRKEKNIQRLLKAFAAARRRFNLRLVIVGDGPERPGLEDLARQLGVADDVEFAGYLTNPLERLKTFDLFALSSDTEQLPISLLEAMACGIPVIATRVGDVPDIVPGVAAQCMCQPDDESFCATLLHAIECRDRWPSWIDAGRDKVVREYSPESMREGWRLILNGELDSVFSASHATGTTV